MKKTFAIVTIALLSLFLVGCLEKGFDFTGSVRPTGETGNGAAAGSGTPSSGSEIEGSETPIGEVEDNPPEAPAGGTETPEEDSGAESQAQATGGNSLTVNRKTFAYSIGYGSAALTTDDDYKYIVLNVTIKNNNPAPVMPFSMLKIYASLTDNGRSCEDEASDLMPGALTPSELASGATRTGLIACRVAQDARNIRVSFSGEEVEIYKYSDVVNDLKSTGNIGEYVGNQYTGALVKVNSYEFINNVTTQGDTTFYGGVSDWSISGCYRDRQAFGAGPGRSSDSCSLLILNVTIKNNIDLPWHAGFNLKRFKVRIGSTGRENIREYHDKFFEVLPKPLNLDDMAYGEERSGQLIYAVGDGIPIGSVPVVFTREDIVRFGITNVVVKSG